MLCCAACAPEQHRYDKAQDVGEVLRPTRGFVLIAFDALRADHLGVYGYDRPTSPFFDELAAGNALFERAMAPYPATLVSNMSLFTGLWPPQHGVYPPSAVLSEAIETLPARFRSRGFRTAGHTEGGFMAGGYGFARGFDEFSDTPYQTETDIERTFERGLEFLRHLDDDDRFFLFLHTYSTHDPYDPPEPYRSMFWDGEQPPAAQPTGPLLRAFNAGRLELADEAIDYYRDLYDGSIRYTDAILEEFIGELEALGLLDDSTLILTSDHGEEFAEHGKLGHTQVYPECLRVPLVVVHPDLAGGRRIPALVSSVDIAPTLYELAGVPPPDRISGRSLVAELTAREPRLSGEAYAEAIDRQSVRSLLRQQSGRLHQLIVFEPRSDPEGTWISDSVSFHSGTSRLGFEIQSFHRPRTVRVSLDGKPHATVEIGTGWQPIELDLPVPPESVRLVTLETDGCDSPTLLGVGDDSRCLAFQIRGIAPQRLELYDLSRDPGATNNLAERPGRVRETLVQRLGSYGWTPVAEPGSRDLSAEAEEKLRALGYLD